MAKQVRVIRNIILTSIFFGLIILLVRDNIFNSIDALLYGSIIGFAIGTLHTWKALRSVSRKHRRFEPNKIFVKYLSFAEIVLSGIAYNIYLAVPVLIISIIIIVFGYYTNHWSTLFLCSIGLTGSIISGAMVIREETKIGPIHYQYDNTAWQGSEGMLYKTGKVVSPLTPRGTVTVRGELWNAVSASRETIAEGEPVEVISIDGLTLFVDSVDRYNDNSEDTLCSG